MTAWLDQHKDRLSSRELWGDIAKQAITFVDLKKCLKYKDQEAEVKKYEGKGKKKASPSPSKPKPKPKKHDDVRWPYAVQCNHYTKRSYK